MSPDAASAAQRAYDEIKQRLLDGRLPLHSRIDVESLARDLALSSMPVRQALSLLTWERLVRPGRHPGYEVALWSALELAQLYAWRGSLLTLVLPTTADGLDLKRTARTQPYVQAVAGAMRLLEVGANTNLVWASKNADDRLHAARLVEGEVLSEVEAEFETLLNAIAEKSRRVGALMKSYQRRRIENAASIRERAVLKALPPNGERA